MGKTIGLIVLLLLLLGGAVWQSVYVRSATEKLTVRLEEVISALEQEDTEKAAGAAEDFNDVWQCEKYKYEALFEHKEVDTISALANGLPSLCDPDYLPEALAEAREISFYVEHIKAIDDLSWENIF